MGEHAPTCASCGGVVGEASAACPSCGAKKSHPPAPVPSFTGRSRRESDVPWTIRIAARLAIWAIGLGFVVSLLGPLLFWDQWHRGQSDEAAAKTQMANFGQAINNYVLQNKKVPASLAELTDAGGRNPYPYIQSIPDDPWGTPYEYRQLDDMDFEIRSAGEDEQMGTEDDITHPSQDD